MLSKNPIRRKQREGYFGESNKSKIWAFIQVMFGFNNVKFAQKQINTFRCNSLIFIYTEGFPTKDEDRFSRTPVIIASVSIEQYHEASRRTAADQMGSPLRSEHQVHTQVPVLLEPRIWESATLGNLVSIGNNQWNQVGMTPAKK
jgi:hypothetical protein